MLTKPEIYEVVTDYIGVDGGYLVGFSYNSHEEFYPRYCGLDIAPSSMGDATTKNKFLKILSEANAITQSKILTGLLRKIPLASFPDGGEIKRPFFENIQRMIARLEGSLAVSAEELVITNSTVERAISDAKLLVERSGATSGVDRIHTALHGYLIEVAKQAGIAIGEEDTMTAILKKLKAQHPALNTGGTRQDDINQIIISFSNALDKLNPIRNRASLSHPNEFLLEEDEALFVINSAQTVLNYLNRKFKI